MLAEVGLFSAAMAESYYCKDCKIVITPVPEKQETTMDKLKKKWNDISDKMEAASEVGVNLKEGYNGDLTSREAGSVGGQMVKKMIESYEKNL